MRWDLKHSNLGDRAYAELRQMIIASTLAPGSAASEPELSQKLEHGKAAVRSALTRLTHEGLMRSIPRHGYVVAPLSLKDALELLEVRLLIEPRTAALAAGRIDPVKLREFENGFRVGYKLADPESVDDYIANNYNYKVFIAEATGNKRLVDIVSHNIELLNRYLRLSIKVFDWRTQGLDNIITLNDTLIAGDRESAEKRTKHIVEKAGTVLIAALLADGSVQQPELKEFLDNEAVVAALSVRMARWSDSLPLGTHTLRAAE